MAYGEVYTALQAGVLDGAENNEVSFVTQRHHEIAPHFTLTNHLVGLDYVLANADQIEGMEASDQEAFQSTFLAAQDEFVRRWVEETDATTETMIEDGVEIHEPDAEAFGTAIEGVAQQFLEDATDQELYDQIRSVAGQSTGADS